MGKEIFEMAFCFMGIGFAFWLYAFGLSFIREEWEEMKKKKGGK